MQRRTKKRWLLNSFWLSILLHLLILLMFSTALLLKPEEEQRQSPNKYVSSYVYTGPPAPTLQPHKMMQQKSQKPTQTTEKTPPQEKIPEETLPKAKNGLKKQSILASSLQMLQQQQHNAIISHQQEDEPIYLIGDKSISDPFILLIGKALSAHFHYPKLAGEFGIRGRVIIGLTVHPEGHFTDVELLKSSNDKDLDSAALYAVNSAPTIRGAERFLSKPKHIVVCYIFD